MKDIVLIATRGRVLVPSSCLDEAASLPGWPSSRYPHLGVPHWKSAIVAIEEAPQYKNGDEG